MGSMINEKPSSHHPQPISPVTPSFASYPLRSGNHLQFWIDGLSFYQRLEEAIDQASHSVWGVISFIAHDFRFPSGRSYWELMDQAHKRGLDVRGLFWSNPRFPTVNAFNDDPKNRNFLAERKVSWKIRWDSSRDDPAHCHHQKSWLIDSGQSSETTFVGGMVLGQQTVDDSQHLALPRSIHDSFAEIRGPGATDVVHNFVQRWNDALQSKDGPWPSPAQAPELEFPKTLSPRQGSTSLQITRSIKANHYHSSTPSPEAAPFSIHRGEMSTWRAYLQSFTLAKSSIYIESQHPGELTLLKCLERALARGVKVVYVVPGEPMGAIVQAKKRAADYIPKEDQEAPRYYKTFQQLARLANYPHFTLAALAVTVPAPPTQRLSYREIYCHSKLAVVDGYWGHCGSANMVDISFLRDHTELNVQFWDAAVAMDLLRKLTSEHTGQSLKKSLSATETLKILAESATQNRERRRTREPLSGFIYKLDPRSYGLHTFPEDSPRTEPEGT